MTATLEPTVGAGAKASTGNVAGGCNSPRQGSRSADRRRAVHGSARTWQHFLDFP